MPWTGWGHRLERARRADSLSPARLRSVARGLHDLRRKTPEGPPRPRGDSLDWTGGDRLWRRPRRNFGLLRRWDPPPPRGGPAREPQAHVCAFVRTRHASCDRGRSFSLGTEHADAQQAPRLRVHPPIFRRRTSRRRLASVPGSVGPLPPRRVVPARAALWPSPPEGRNRPRPQHTLGETAR